MRELSVRAGSRLATVTEPPCRSAACLTIDEPEPRARHRPGVVGAVEPLEDHRQVASLDARAFVGDGRARRSTSRTVTVPPGGPHLAALSSRLVTARSRICGLTDHPPRRRGDVERRRPGRAGVTRSTARDDDVGEVERLRRARQRLVAGELDEVADQRRQLLDLGGDVVEDLVALLCCMPPRRSAWASSSRLVRRLVSGVRSSCPASTTSRRCRSREACSAASILLNDVARLASSSSPVTAIGRELLGPGDVLGGRAQPSYGRKADRADGEADQPRGDDAAAADERAGRDPSGRACARSARSTARTSARRPTRH